MVVEVARYQFQSWARKGISAQIKELDTLGDPAAALPPGERALVPIGVSVNAAPQAAKDFAVIGPGDIVGVHRDMIVRTEPLDRISNFEANYLAFIEFYDEDFLWRYTPARPDDERLRPWLQLLVLEEDEYERGDARLPLPTVTVKSGEALPSSRESWLFAHVHTEQDIGGDLSDLELYLKSLQAAVTTDPDKIYCRLLSPRHLAPNRAYQAFLVPAFEAGRLTGLGRPTTGVPAQKPAWDESTTGLELPFYFSWSFSTGEAVGFESLIALLKPRVLDEKIGIRSMDCSRPGFLVADDQGRARPVPPGGQPGLPAPIPAVQGLEGALKTDRTKSAPVTFTPNAFQVELQHLVNLPETVHTVAAPPESDDEFLNDPIVTLPLYGRNHARQRKSDSILLDTSKDGWYHDLNRDPRTRVPAGLGTSVIQKHQEKLMQKAWQQVQKVYDANRIIRRFQFGMQVSSRYATTFFVLLPAARLIAVTAPIHAKVLGSPTTIRQQLTESRLASPVFSAAFRRMVRPAGKLARRAGAGGQRLDYPALVEAVNEGRITPAAPRTVPAGIPSLDALATRIQPSAPPGWLRWLIRRRWWVLAIGLALALLAGLAAGAWEIAAVAVSGSLGAFAWLAGQARRNGSAAALVDPAAGMAALAAVPPRPDFAVDLDSGPPVSSSAGPGPGPGPGPAPAPGASTDSADARDFRTAALDLQARALIRVEEKPPLPAFDIANAHAKLVRAIQPRIAFPRRLDALVKLPNLSLAEPEEIVDAMAHPDFEEPTYSYLRDLGKELLIPNLNLIPPDTISLLETNPRFIESFMVGLNHEMGRELLWREYPTDMRGSYFRQFWEVKGISNPDTPANADQLKDITKIHAWPAASPLGAHKPPPGAGADVQPGEKQLVLVVRGELLKRYPNTVVYAQKAIDDGAGNKILRETDLTPEQFDRELKFPLFRACIDPDLRFFGFDLTVPKARGVSDSVDFPNDRLGWFFVIQEVPGEPRFGMDVSYRPTGDSNDNPADDPRDTWDNLAWDRFGAAEPAFVSAARTPVFPRPNLAELGAHPWCSTSAQMAYILFQVPVMVAVHATEMLEGLEK